MMTIALDRRHFLAGSMAMGACAAVAAPRPSSPFFERTGKAIGLQLYTLGDEPAKDPAAVFAKLAEIGYRDLELPSLLGRKPIELRAAADAAGVKFSSIHLAPPPLAQPGGLGFESPSAEIADALGVLGITDAVLPIAYLPEGQMPDLAKDFRGGIVKAYRAGGVDGWKRTADLTNRKALSLSGYGISVGYHNHDVEFAPIGGTTGWDVLMREFDRNLVYLELDLGWVAAAGRDPAAMLRRYAGRVRSVHVKDLEKPTARPTFALGMKPTEVGSGSIDWSRTLRAADAAGVRHYYVEQEPPFAIPRMDAVAKSYAFLSKVV